MKTRMKKNGINLLSVPLLLLVIFFVAELFAFEKPGTTGIFSMRNSFFFADSTPPSFNRLSDKEYIKSSIRYDAEYPFINYTKNYFEWPDNELAKKFFSKLANADNKKVTVLHIGDSHVQADFFTGYIRTKLQDVFGYAGRGLMFPYKAARTHAAYDYSTSASGTWNNSKNTDIAPSLGLGITGATVSTSDPSASFQISFYSQHSGADSYRIRVLRKASESSFGLTLQTNGGTFTMKGDANSPYLEAVIPGPLETLSFSMTKTSNAQFEFECYGVLVESTEDKGILYASVGINGAGLKSLLRSTLLASQIDDLNPDLVVIDLGGNDFYKGQINRFEVKSDLVTIVRMIKTAAPDVVILMSNSQDVYERSRNITACLDYSEITREVAFEEKCLFYDYYNVSGGQYSMLDWRKENLAQWDKVHLTPSGYDIKGQLYVNAYLNSYYAFLAGDVNRSFMTEPLVVGKTNETPQVIQEELEKKEPVVEEKKNESQQTDPITQPIYSDETPAANKVYHIVKRGETLGVIANTYAVTEEEIKRWNSLSSNTVSPGATLIVFTMKDMARVETNQVVEEKKEEVKPPTIEKKKTQQKKKKTQSAFYHKVKKGETLSSIAWKYRTTVAKIKKWNNLRRDTIRSGQHLKIYR